MSTTVLSNTTTAIARPSAKEVLAAVRDLQSWLREHQAAAENERRIPQETIELLDKAGVFQLTSPLSMAAPTSLHASYTTFTARSDPAAARPVGWSGPPRVVTNGVQPLPTMSSHRFIRHPG